MEREAPFGYVFKDGKLEVNKTEAEVIKWLYQMVKEYCDNPPEILVRDVMARNADERLSNKNVKKLTFEEAKDQVSISLVERYICAELNLRMEQYEKEKQGDTPQEIREFLVRSLDKESLTEIEERYKTGRRDTYSPRRIFGRKVNQYIGKMEPLSGNYKISAVTENIVSKELYESVLKKIKENREQVTGEAQDNSCTQILG